MPPLAIKVDPPILNSASPWATTKADLQSLYDCPYTGAVTVRTSLLNGFKHDEKVHQYTFFEARGGGSAVDRTNTASPAQEANETSSLNTLGYSPVPTFEYIDIIRGIILDGRKKGEEQKKPFIISVTGTSDEVKECYGLICHAANGASTQQGKPIHIYMEVNLSCPNIAGKPPPAYEADMLREYLQQLRLKRMDLGVRPVPVGIKTPPYTYMGQFEMLVGGLEQIAKTPGGCPVDFITATNTLGSSLVLSNDDSALAPALASESGTGIGGLAGAALHPLALGNVATLRRLLDQHVALKDIQIIGVGGVSDGMGFKRMRSVGAGAVALATAFGREGVGVFEKIYKEGVEAEKS